MLLFLIPIWLSLASRTSSSQILGSFKLHVGSPTHGLKSSPLEILNTKTIRIPNFHYDGTAPDAFWIVGLGNVPEDHPTTVPGFKVPDNEGTCKVLKPFKGETIDLILPSTMTVNQLSWLGIYDFQDKSTFGFVDIATVRNGNRFQNVPDAPSTLVAPQTCGQPTIIRLANFTLRPNEAFPLPHNVRSGPVEIINIKTIRIVNLHYDGKGPDTYWMVGSGDPPLEHPKETSGQKIPNDKGSCDVLKMYHGETIESVLPGNFTVDNIDWLAIHCIKYKHTFGWVNFKTPRGGSPASFGILREADVPPPHPCHGLSRKPFQLLPGLSASALLLNWLAAPFRFNL